MNMLALNGQCWIGVLEIVRHTTNLLLPDAWNISDNLYNITTVFTVSRGNQGENLAELSREEGLDITKNDIVYKITKQKL